MMKSKPKWLNVSYDLFRTQAEWTMWYVGVIVLIYLLGGFVFNFVNSENFSMSDMGLSSIRGFLLIIGIITAAYGTKIFLKVGVTRKTYFLGNLLSTYLLSLAIFIAFTLVHLAMLMVLKSNEWGTINFQYFIQWMVLSSQFYFMGWTAALAFQRFKVIGGIMVAVLLLGVLILLEALWNAPLFNEINFLFWSVEVGAVVVPFVLALALSLVITLLTLFSIYKLSQNLEINV